MTRSEARFVPATHELLKRYYGREPLCTVRGFVALVDDEPVGVLGVYYLNKQPLLFSEMKPEVRHRKKDIVKAYRLLEEFASGFKYPLWAVAQCGEKAAEGLLQRLGFVPTGHEMVFGPIYYRGI